MNQLEGLLILTALPLSLLLTGYWVAALLVRSDPVERLAFALPCGLALLLAAAAAVNFFQPLRGVWAFACLAPILLTLLLPRSRTGLVRDLVATARTAPRLVLAAVAVFFVLLLWPVLQTPATIYYDGTSNHDSFFWIAGAEHLKRHTYMTLPAMSSTQPLTNNASALIGWNPPWGRIGGEALLALASSVINVSPLKLYLYATASLAAVWFALVYLAFRTFVADTPARLTAAAIVCLQPLFVFFYGNANLPNLLGTLTGTALIVALERALRAGPAQRSEFTAWAALAALSLHGLLCSYPEMVPFALLPCGLLWLRPWFTRGPAAHWRTGLLVAGILLAGAALNPASTVRAVSGFLTSYAQGRADTTWANLFAPLDHAEYVPALATLSIAGCKELGWWLGWPLSVLIVGLLALVVRRSRDPYGLCAGLAGSAVLFAYTVTMDFSYGWQKTVQFSGIFVAVFFPAAATEVLWRLRATAAGTGRQAATAALAAILIFTGYAGVMNCRDIYKWSDRKVISADWFQLRDQSRGALAGAAVLVEPASFRMAFFHGMWAAYFLTESRTYYGARGEENGGYLRAWAVNEQKTPIPAPAAILVGRRWSDTFDANSPRLLTGTEYSLLQKNNRVFALTGMHPLNGLPDYASGAITFEILPHSASHLLIELAPRAADTVAGTWHLARRAEGSADFAAVVAGPPPWRLKIPLTAGQRNQVEINLQEYGAAREGLVFALSSLRIEDGP